MIPLAIGLGAAGLAGGVANFFANKSASDRAEEMQKRALEEWLKVNVPDQEVQKLVLQDFQQTGRLHPKLIEAIQSNPTAYREALADPRAVEAQRSALNQLQDISNQGGMSLSEQAGLDEQLAKGASHARSERQGISAEMARRGMSNSGFDLASKLQGAQADQDTESKTRLQAAGMAQDRALKAIEDRANFAGNLRAQDFSEKSARAGAEDRMSMFNTQNARSMAEKNAQAMNLANARNLEESQRLSDANINMRNYQQEHNKGLYQQQFENQAKVAAGKSGQYGQMAQGAYQQGANQGNFYSNLAGAATHAAGQFMNYKMMDDYFNKNKKSV